LTGLIGRSFLEVHLFSVVCFTVNDSECVTAWQFKHIEKYKFTLEVDSTRNTTMKEIYHPYFLRKLILITITSGFFSLKLFSSWGSSGSLVHLFFAISLLLIFIACSKPLIEWKRIEIENGYIIIFKRFFKPLKIKISESLYQVIIKDENIRSFRFRYGKYYTQVSPIIYENGDEMTKTVTDYMNKHKISVEVVTQRI
jgi:hypothetical protein